ncbi:MAG: SET domain-containing protein-lysine N-methyltransferase [Verrucomicrobia bacterium]|nr:SET domain-containing protein-lysine N-methyltransferase [Verrucomicrobiota bacterium]
MIPIQNTDYPMLVAKESGIHGYACFANQSIQKGGRLIEYTGPRITAMEAVTELRNGNGYIFILASAVSIDGSVNWNFARYINHGCDPNCESEIEEGRVLIYAARTIKEGEELTLNYACHRDGFIRRACECGAKNCHGYMITEGDTKLVSTMIAMSKEIGKRKC